MKKIQTITISLLGIFYLIAITAIFNLYKSPISIFKDFREILNVDISIGVYVVVKLLWVISIVIVIGILFSAYKLSKTIDKWSKSKERESSFIIKDFKTIGKTLIITGAIATSLMGFRLLEDYAFIKEHLILGMNLLGSLFILSCGLLFTLFSEILKVNQLLKEENELTI
ncbi:hypothetical protein [uncultured Aquimarina sp.]|uniref:hypothetical protein n=1 Tax=uncultured Aquimarina sp. TaxID=575652 RepID=UPI00260837B0|nr:hypothetical protein [uncultured Aquimarina sp.]